MEQERHLVIQVQNLHCYSCLGTFNDFNTFRSHNHIDNASRENQNEIQDDVIKPRISDGSSNNCYFTPSQQEKQKTVFEQLRPTVKKIRKYKDNVSSPSTATNSSIDKPSTKIRNKEKKLVNFFHCPNCYEVFNRLSTLKDHFSNCTHKPSGTFQEFQLNRIQNKNLKEYNDKLSLSTHLKLKEEPTSSPNINSSYTGNETSSNELYFDLEVRCTKCKLDFIFFDDLIDHLKTLHLKSSKEPIHSHLSPLASPLQPQLSRKEKNISTLKTKKTTDLEDSEIVQIEDNEQNSVDSLPDDDTEFDSDNHFSTDSAHPHDENEDMHRNSENENDSNWTPSQEEVRTDAEREKKLFLSSLSLSDKKQNNRKRSIISNDDAAPQTKKKRRRKHQPPKSEFLCEVFSCGEKFSSKRNLRTHQKIMHDILHSKQKPKPLTTGEEDVEKKYCCEICGKAYRKKCDLTQHLVTHTGERNWICEFEGCGRSFTRSSFLRRHERGHRGELPHLCFTCGLVFRDNCSLKSHVNTHTGDKPYKCTVTDCNKAYAGARALRAHIETHKNERNFQCDLCPSAFNFFNVLKKHLKSHERTKTIKASKSSS